MYVYTRIVHTFFYFLGLFLQGGGVLLGVYVYIHVVDLMCYETAS
jgi:hypothetical protein